MVLLEVVVQILVGPVNNLAPKLIPDRTRIGIMAIAGYTTGDPSSDLESVGKEGLGGCHVSGFTEADIDQVSIPVNRPVKIIPLACPCSLSHPAGSMCGCSPLAFAHLNDAGPATSPATMEFASVPVRTASMSGTRFGPDVRV